jgi:multidrug efflux pump subunit AcrB
MALSGEGQQRDESLGSLLSTYPLALLIIFALLAIPLKSYGQPLIIMSVIPFGAIGAIMGHFIMGQELVFFSLIGIVALGGCGGEFQPGAGGLHQQRGRCRSQP